MGNRPERNPGDRLHLDGVTTACTCGIFARAMVEGRLSGKGMLSAEQLAKDDDFYNWVMAEQAKRGICYKEKVEVEKNAALWKK